MKLKNILYWLSIVQPILDIVKGAWQGIVNVIIQEDVKRQQVQFCEDEYNFLNLKVDIKENKDGKSV